MFFALLKENGNISKEVFGTTTSSKHLSEEERIKDAIVQAYVWVVWKGRNDKIFKGDTLDTLRAANDIQALVSWICNRSDFGKNLRWTDWSCKRKDDSQPFIRPIKTALTGSPSFNHLHPP
ncbi:hypothetical protein OSB04_030265 [Centaurea solstitialis]|uniref:Uncharacterized protein n=1 Tax=Centaurea solstitialis TaxID=347529 RepID=A0AA38VT29_9ASTR|nr:hypothetical protein OSB04_030265 [Centaurea solstitialis]